MRNDKPDITPDTNVGKLLDEYPELEDKFIVIAPAFEKLKKPFLRKTVARVTSLRQAAKVAGVELGVLINGLRSAAGMETVDTSGEPEKSVQDKPEWVKTGKLADTYNATADLENGRHPAARVTKDVKKLGEGEIYLLITPFLPAPLIDILVKEGYRAWSENSGKFTKTFVTK